MGMPQLWQLAVKGTSQPSQVSSTCASSPDIGLFPFPSATFSTPRHVLMYIVRYSLLQIFDFI
jgi:hypothetical protein